ncbi:hypothetical protein AVEN_99634-1 [Araneus ventricosus]|uniref:Uncharacterized protein n=1 Tax=Araneus ventricosus TaxID=182803 RepID=A0A4Y2T339_ARAVE|nr:hypothetical protein AVEN_196827-1 [Araneus ventricosus]GBN94620.1 hypothetical protein AVEN_213095-1 [Araneus ventricosus]GBN94959.1 hypothetical protein AVEN_177944-1 [Araneus ventricosus]GBN94977.1 hypothetical protein AVEN_99634-1 [Araneus ventricosus]
MRRRRRASAEVLETRNKVGACKGGRAEEQHFWGGRGRRVEGGKTAPSKEEIDANRCVEVVEKCVLEAAIGTGGITSSGLKTMSDEGADAEHHFGGLKKCTDGC